MSYGRYIKMSSSNMVQRKDAANRSIRSGHSNVAIDFVCLLSCVVSGVFVLSSKRRNILKAWLIVSYVQKSSSILCVC